MFRAKRGQAMLETLLAVLFLTSILFALFILSRMVTARILLDHAAARAARARAVGFNDYMCLKSARVAMIPVAGRRLWPEEGGFDEASRIPIYLCTENDPIARGVLEYENWNRMSLDVSSGAGLAPVAEASIWMGDEDYSMDGHAAVESHYPLYMKTLGGN